MSSKETADAMYAARHTDYKSLQEVTGLSDQMVSEFSTAGLGDGNKLRNAKLEIRKGRDGGTYYAWKSSTGENIDSLVNSFTQYAAGSGKAQTDWKSYVEAKKGRPGRDATLLMPDTSPDSSNPALLLGE